MMRPMQILPLLPALHLLAGCVSFRTVELEPAVTGRQWTRNIVETGERIGCVSPWAPTVAGEREDGLRAGFEQEDHSDSNCGYYVNDMYQALMRFDLDIPDATLIRRARLEIDTRNMVRTEGAWGSRCDFYVARAAENWAFGYNFGPPVETESGLLVVDGFARDTHQTLDVTRLVRPQLNDDNKGIVITPHLSMLERGEVADGDQVSCYTIVSNPRLWLELVIPDRD